MLPLSLSLCIVLKAELTLARMTLPRHYLRISLPLPTPTLQVNHDNSVTVNSQLPLHPYTTTHSQTSWERKMEGETFQRRDFFLSFPPLSLTRTSIMRYSSEQ